MNRRKIVLRFMALAMCLVLVTGFGLGFSVKASTYSATDKNSLLQAIKDAADGDVILFFGTIEQIDNLGYANKQITLKRGNADSCLITTQGIDATIQNIVFDGGGFKSNQPLLKVQGDFTIQDSVFQNCGDPENRGSSGCIGGAVQVNFGSSTFIDCSFNSNNAIVGGHIAILGNAAVTLTGCTLKNGYSVASGGGISVSGNASCNIDSCVITGNEAGDFGGGIANASSAIINNTKLFNNAAVNGGADIGNKIGATADLRDSVEQLVELFSEDNIIPKGWICDYDFEEGLYIPDVDPTIENSLLKLDFEYKQPEPEEPTEPETLEEPDPEEPGEPVDPDPEPSEPEQPTDPDNQQPEENNDPDGEPSKPDNGSQQPDDSSNPDQGQDEDKDNKGEESQPGTSAPPSSTTETTTITNNTSTTDSSVTDNTSRTTRTTDSNNTTTTTNNYYTTQQQAANEQLPANTVQSNGSGNGNLQMVQANSEPQQADNTVMGNIPFANIPNIRIEANGADCIFEANENGISIYINANTNTNSVSLEEPTYQPVMSMAIEERADEADASKNIPIGRPEYFV